MPFVQHRSFTAARIGRAMSLRRAHIDPATAVLTFVYQELVDQSGVWVSEEKQQVLVGGTHYSLNAGDGQVTLLDHPFWQQLGLWRAADRPESLLYKGQVTHPQRIDFDYEHYAPEAIEVLADLTGQGQPGKVLGRRPTQAAAIFDMEEIDPETTSRLGYDLPRYSALVE